jgi:hypothetical protein
VSGELDRPRGGEKISHEVKNFFFLEKFSCFRGLLREPIQVRAWLGNRRPGSVSGFRALKYDVRHTPIVIERIAKEWKLKRT